MESSNDEVEARALKVLEEATEQEWRVYEEATAPAAKVLEETLTKAFQTCREIETQARRTRDEAIASALKKFGEDTEPYWQAYLKARKEAEGP